MYLNHFKLTESTLALEDRIKNAEIARENMGRLDRPDLVSWGARSLPSRRCVAAIAAFIGGKSAIARSQASHVAKDASDYFFGDWRRQVPTDEGKIDPDWWLTRDAWTEAYRAALCCVSSLGDWEGLKTLSQFPLKSPCRKPGSGDFSPAQVQLLAEIAAYLQGHAKSGVEVRYSAMTGANWRSYRFLARALDCLIAGNKVAAGEETLQFLEAHHKRKRATQIDDTVSIDATFFINLLSYEGSMPSLPEKLLPYYFKPQ